MRCVMYFQRLRPAAKQLHTCSYNLPVKTLFSSKKFVVSIPVSQSRACSNNMSIRLFEDESHAKIYAKFRPTYPDDVFKVIWQYCIRESSYRFDLAVDVGCGNGQSTLPLTKAFEKVIGIDISESQIHEAKNVNTDAEFRVGPAEELGFLKTGSVDLITSAQAFHWMDHGKFFAEVSRVLKPRGVLAVYGYGNCKVNKDEAQEVIWKFYSETLDGFWDTHRKSIDLEYRNYELPFDGWERNDSLYIRNTWSINSFVGYLSSWSGWRAYRKQNPESRQLQEVHEKLKGFYTDNEKEEMMTITWPIFMLLGRKTEYR